MTRALFDRPPRLRRQPTRLGGARTFASLAGLFLLAALSAAAADPPAAAVAAYQKARQQLADGAGPAAALDSFETALRLDPDNLRWGSEYRQAAIAAEAFDRSIDFFAALTEAHPGSASARLNLGYAHVDKIPAAGSITQVLLANTALGHFTQSLELEESWLVRYTRGNSYIHWPAIFGKAKLGIADLERAIELARALPKRGIHARAWVALGDGHWRLDDLAKARETWLRGLELYPGTAALEARLSREGDALQEFLDGEYALGKKVDTDLSALWEGR
ncbi:MAG TPA: hypothetical protein VF100_09780 [Thermoanaerobaculia bacterium]